MLADAVGDFGEFALVGADGGEVVGLADEVEGAESFPDLLVTRGDSGDFSAGSDVCAGGNRQRSNAARNGRAKFVGLIASLELGDEAALVDDCADFVGVGHVAGSSGDDYGGLQQSDDLRTACRVAEADEG